MGVTGIFSRPFINNSIGKVMENTLNADREEIMSLDVWGCQRVLSVLQQTVAVHEFKLHFIFHFLPDFLSQFPFTIPF